MTIIKYFVTYLFIDLPIILILFFSLIDEYLKVFTLCSENKYKCSNNKISQQNK
jgi:hypothetical protein